MKKKLFFIFILLVSLGVVISSVLSISLLNTSHEENIRANLIENALIIKAVIEDIDSELMNNYEFINKLSTNLNTRITLVNKTGRVVYDTEPSINGFDNHSHRPEIVEAKLGDVGFSKRFSNSLKKDMYYVAVLVDSEKIEIARLSIPLNTFTEYTDSILSNIIISTLVGIMLATMLGARFFNMFTEPLYKLTEATKNVADGNYGERVFIASNDEIGELADSFNVMSVELENIINDLKESNMTNRAILKSMINGVVAVDNDYNIMFVNKAAQEMFGINEKNVIGNNVTSSFKGHILEDLFNRDFDVSGKIKSELIVENPYRVYRIFSNVIRDKEKTLNTMGLLMNFVDITQMRNLENMRKDFVANVSHELKTPLTSIQGFIETLKEGAADNKNIRDKFIDIIDIEANRLKILIDDILVLSDIEKKEVNDSRFEDISIIEVIDDIKEMIFNIAKKKNIEVVFDIQDNMGFLHGNKMWIKQMFVNLIDNAVKYTPDNGKVEVIVKDLISNINIEIKDNGIGIEEENISRLFERFYRVDKARSKKVGGTGLGLAIVKHIVISFEGEIIVKSKINKGTSFIINIPK